MKITDCKNVTHPINYRLSTSESGFICFDKDIVKFSQNALELCNGDNKIRLQLKHTLLGVQTLCQKSSYLYSKVLNECPLLFRTFDKSFEAVDTRDQFIIKDSLFVVKFTNINGKYRLNQLKDLVDEKESSFIEDSCIYQQEIEEISAECMICGKNGPEQMLEICDCKNMVHLECHKLKYEPLTIIKEHTNITKIVIDNYGCNVCGKRYDSKLKSIRNI